jgi:MFS family permease
LFTGSFRSGRYCEVPVTGRRRRCNSINAAAFFRRYTVAIAAFIIMMISAGIGYSFGVFLKPLFFEFGWTRASISGAYSLSSLVAGLAGIFMGGLVDRRGPRFVLAVCGLIAGVGYLLMSQVSALWQLYLFYGIVIGIGSSTFAPLLSTISRLYVKRRTTVSGIVTVGIGLGSLVMPPLTNHLIITSDWRTSFIVLGVLTIVFLTLSSRFLRVNAVTNEQSKPGGEKASESTIGGQTAALSFRDAVATRQFWIIFIMFFCMGFCVLTAQIHIFSYVTDFNISATVAANITAAIGGSSIIGRIVLGAVADRIGNRKALIIGFALMAAPVLCLIFAREVWVFFLLVIVFGIGYGDCVASESPLVASVFGLKSIGSILGVLSGAFTFGAAAGPVVAGYIFDTTASYVPAFILTAVTGVIGLLLAIYLSPLKSRPKLQQDV